MLSSGCVKAADCLQQDEACSMNKETASRLLLAHHPHSIKKPGNA
jgi:hypothetical protein